MHDKNIYAIVDIDGYVREMRDAAAKSLASDDKDDLDTFITIKQMISLVKSECLGFDSSDRPLLNEMANEKIYESTVVWIHGVGLAKLAAQDLIECAWDSDINEMVFWPKETKNAKSKRKNKRPKR